MSPSCVELAECNSAVFNYLVCAGMYPPYGGPGMMGGGGRGGRPHPRGGGWVCLLYTYLCAAHKHLYTHTHTHAYAMFTRMCRPTLTHRHMYIQFTHATLGPQWVCLSILIGHCEAVEMHLLVSLHLYPPSPLQPSRERWRKKHHLVQRP